MGIVKKILDPDFGLFSLWRGWPHKSEPGKSIIFKYFEPDHAINLGSPDEIESVQGNFRDGGYQLKFTTTESSAGIEERFALYLYPCQLKEMTLRLWAAFLVTEPDKARDFLKDTIKELKKISKQLEKQQAKGDCADS